MEVLERTFYKMNKDYDAIRNKINELENKKKLINDKIYSIREQRSLCKLNIDNGKDNYDEYIKLSEKIDTLRSNKDDLSREINILHKQLIS